MELDDNEFDAAFRKRVFDADPEFEESAWNKMEGKLKRRERVVLFRKVGAALSVLFLLGLIAYYSFDFAGERKTQPQLAGKGKTENGLKSIPVQPENKRNGGKTGTDTLKGTVVAENKTAEHSNDSSFENQMPKTEQKENSVQVHPVPVIEKRSLAEVPKINTLPALIHSGLSSKEPGQPAVQHNLQSAEIILNPVFASASAMQAVVAENNVIVPENRETLPANKATASEKKKNASGKQPFDLEKKKPVLKRPIPMSLAVTLGPEFNSASSLVGGKTGFNGGLTFSMGIAKKIRLETGLKYSRKDYQTDGFAYRWKNPAMGQIIANIDAACAVLEIPVRASYTVFEDFQRSVDLNVGLSSYLMLKEDYTFNYKPEVGLANRLLEKVNANQHFLSVIDLSATYFIRLKTERFKIGVEPFVKIPLTGIGEGSVNLKSSGISLKVRYDLDRKH